MQSNNTRVVFLAAAVLLVVLPINRARAQGEYLRLKEFGAEAQFVYATASGLSAAGVAAGFSFWGCLDPGIQVLRYSGSRTYSYTVYAVGATAHPFKPLIQSPLQPYVSFSYLSAERDRGSGPSESIGLYAQAPLAKEFMLVPDAFLAWSQVDPGPSVEMSGGGIGIGIKTSSSLMVVLSARYTDQGRGDGVGWFGIGLLEIQPNRFGH